MVARLENLETTCEYFSKCKSLAKREDVELKELDDLFKCYSGGKGCFLKELYSPVSSKENIILGVKSW